jgi:hypothetical protein
MGGFRFGLLEGFGAFLLAALAACGGRSSTLEPDSVNIDANQPIAGSTAKPGPSATVGGAGSVSASGGKSGVPTGGSSSSGGTGGSGATAGVWMSGAASGGSAGVDTQLFVSCADYCTASSQRRPCASGISGPECMASCTSEVSAYGPECQRLGSALLDCLTKVYKNSSSCSEVDELSIAKCSALFTSYQGCVAPTADPLPTPDPPPPPLTCSSSSSSSNGKCAVDVKCTSGAYYSVSCYETSPDQSSCTCNASFPNGSASGGSFGLNVSATSACYASLATCGFPQIGAP